jgi:hypothetical protein
VAKLSAYFDASGHPDMPAGAMFMSGFVSTDEKWLKFERAWLRLLEENEIDSPFHMTDFAGGWKQFAGWKGHTARQNAFLAEAVHIINKFTIKDFSQGIVVEDFRRVHLEYLVPDGWGDGVLATPIAYCGVGAFMKLRDWAIRRSRRNNFRLDGPPELVYDRNDQDRGTFDETMWKVFKLRPIRRDARSAVALQATDILAWEHARQFHPRSQQHGVARSMLMHMAEKFPGSNEWVVARWPRLREYCEEKGFVRRETPRVSASRQH